MSASKKTLCLEDLRHRILSLDLEPGSDLDETRLTQTYGISRTPLREVLQRLAGKGYIQTFENRGAKVSSMDISAMRMFFQTAPLVYTTMSRLAAEHRTTRQLDDLKAVQVSFQRASRAGSAEQSAASNHDFHRIIGEMAHNVYLMPSLDRMLIDHTRLSQTFYRPASDQEAALVEKACDQHDALIAAIEAQEPSLAIDLTLQHWDLSRDQLERFVRPDPLPLDVVSLKDKRHAV